MQITDIESALILVGKNNTGKTAVLDAIRAVTGAYTIGIDDFQEDYANIEISITLAITDDDLHRLHAAGLVSSYLLIIRQPVAAVSRSLIPGIPWPETAF